MLTVVLFLAFGGAGAPRARGVRQETHCGGQGGHDCGEAAAEQGARSEQADHGRE